MNPWDLVTWLMSATLGVSAVVIFVYFLKDARKLFEREWGRDDRD